MNFSLAKYCTHACTTMPSFFTLLFMCVPCAIPNSMIHFHIILDLYSAQLYDHKSQVPKHLDNGGYTVLSIKQFILIIAFQALV